MFNKNSAISLSSKLNEEEVKNAEYINTQVTSVYTLPLVIGRPLDR